MQRFTGLVLTLIGALMVLWAGVLRSSSGTWVRGCT